MGFFANKRGGLYIALALCLVATVAVGAMTLGREAPAEEVINNEEVEDTTPIIKPLPPSVPVIKDEPVEVEPVVEEPAELLPQVVSPLDGTTVTVFSMNELLYDETMGDWRTHEGLDIQASDGDAVKTAAGGTIQSVTKDELMGTTVTIAHSGGYVTYYSSLRSDPPISEGQQVYAGDIIGYVGTAAAESDMGPHLHFAVSKDGTLIDPQEYVKK